MTRHGRHTPVIRSLPNKRRLAKMTAFVAAARLVTTAGVVTRGFYRADNAKPISAITSFSATDSAASHSAVRGTINSADKDTSFVTVKINGDSRVVLGEKGVMETTSLVKRAGGAVVSSNVFTSWVKKAPVDKVILVGTGSGSTAASDPQSGGLGTTVPAGEIQSWAHQYLLDNGYSEGDFTAANYIISHESGWSPTATNPSSGAYGLAQAYPGSKMASVGADWQTNYRTQFKWFIGYCEQRYAASSRRTTTGSRTRTTETLDFHTPRHVRSVVVPSMMKR